MKKILALVLCFCILGASVSAASVQMDMGKTDVRCLIESEFEKKQIETAPFTVNGRTMVPVRVIAESFGAQVGWEEATQTVTVSAPEKEIALVLGQSEALVNGQSVTLDAAATEKNGRTMVPLRFVAETLGYNVKYLPSAQQIYITDSPIVLQSAHSFVTVEEIAFVYGFYQDSFVPTPESGASEAEISNAKAALLSQICNLYMNYYPFYDYLVYTTGAGVPAEATAVVTESMKQYVPQLDEAGMLNVYVGIYNEMIATAETFAEKLVAAVPEEALAAAYEKAYICAKHILIPTVNLQSGDALSEKEVQAAQTLAQSLCKQLAEGADFDALMREYSKDGGLVANPDGYVFTAGEMVEEFYNGATALEVGAVSEPILSMFGYHIIKREPLPEMSNTIREKLVEPAVAGQLDSIYAGNRMQMVMEPELLMSIFN